MGENYHGTQYIKSCFDNHLFQYLSRYQKDILTVGENYHGTQYIKSCFDNHLFQYLILQNWSEKALVLAQNGIFFILGLF